ncbi:MAG: acyl carrier protein [Firmicutes bacterium]|nr:acyl carrier protein [Bacillota bacterium]
MLEQVKKLLASELNISEDKIVPEANLQDDLGADSLDLIELLTAMEENLGIQIPTEEASEIKTIADVVKIIEAKKK